MPLYQWPECITLDFILLSGSILCVVIQTLEPFCPFLALDYPGIALPTSTAIYASMPTRKNDTQTSTDMSRLRVHDSPVHEAFSMFDQVKW